MKYLTFIFLIISSLGCGKSVKLNIHPDFQHYFMKFSMHASNLGKELDLTELSVQFNDLPSNYCGMCTHSGVGSVKVVEIDHSCWDNQSDLTREELLFHEFGHCLLNRGHENGLRPDRTPISIMYPYLIGDTTYQKYYDDYIKELFK